MPDNASRQPVRVTMEATFLLRTYMPDWRDDANLDAVARVMEAMFEEVSISVEGERVGPCTCPMTKEDFLMTGEPGENDPACPWHGDR